MAKRKKGMETTLTNWAYQNKKAGTKASGMIRSLEEVRKALDELKKGK